MKSLTAILALGVCLSFVACGGSSGPTTTITVPPPPSGGEVFPNYFNPQFQQPYQAFMKAVVSHYGGNPSIGYIRFGLGQGGETYPALGFTSDATCSNAFTSWGWTAQSWTSYLTSMLTYEGTLGSPKQLMVGLNTVNNDTTIPDTVAATAVINHIGIGSQGFQQSDIAAFNSATPCTADWCALFAQYPGPVPPLELQTLTQSDPTGANQTGSLDVILPFAVARGVNILELYYQDWLTAFDSNYSVYQPSYATDIQNAQSAGVQMEVLNPPSSGADASAVQTLLMPNPAVSGANFFVAWADVDQGPSANPQYVWTSIDNEIAPWIAAGKKVNLIVWAISDASINTSTPTYVLTNLGSANTTTCIKP